MVAAAHFGCPVPIDVHGSVTSTNDCVAAIDTQGWAAVTADEQVDGRGRLDRQWSSPWGAGIALSVRAPVREIRVPLSQLPMRMAVAVTRALRAHGVMSDVKWPNDIMLSDRKCGGMLIVLQPLSVIFGVGINVSLRDDELPVPTATSLHLNGYDVERESLIAAITANVHSVVTSREPVRQEYAQICSTIDRDVDVSLISGDKLSGKAVGLSDDGALIVLANGQSHIVAVGDVVHVRPQ